MKMKSFLSPTRSSTIARFLLAWGIAIFVVLPAAALDANEQQLLASVQSSLNQSMENYNLALQTAGPGTAPPKGSKKRLTQLRLDQAKANLPDVAAKLEQLPDDDENVSAAQASYDELKTATQALQNRIDGKSATAPTAESEAKQEDKEQSKQAEDSESSIGEQPKAESDPDPEPAAPTTVRLSYPQEKPFRDARFHLGTVEGHANSLTEMHAKLIDVEDYTTIDHRTVAQAMTWLEDGITKAGYVKKNLDVLPANGEGVAELTERYNASVEVLQGAQEFFPPLHQKLSTLVSPSSFPSFEADMRKLAELSRMFREPMELENDPARAAETVQQAKAAYQEAQKLYEPYQILVTQNTAMGERALGTATHFANNYKAYAAKAQEIKTTQPAEIEKYLAEAQSYADQAVADQKPGFFNGGIPQLYEFIENEMKLYRLLAAEDAKAMDKTIESTKQKIADQAKSLEQQIIAENKPPQQNYQGDDTQQLIDIATKSWKEIQPDAEVLGAAVVSSEWTRNTRWRFSGDTATKYDTSKLQVQLIVADQDPRLAVIRPINLVKNHLQNDRIIPYPMDAIGEELPPHRYMLREKLQ
jgi:hypothetical protein